MYSTVPVGKWILWCLQCETVKTPWLAECSPAEAKTLLPFCSSLLFPRDQVKHSYRLPPASVHCFQLKDPVFPIKSAIPEQTDSQKERVKHSYCSLELKNLPQPCLPQTITLLSALLPTNKVETVNFTPLWEVEMLLHRKLLVALLFGMVKFKQIHPNHINDSWVREGFIAVKRY